MIASVFGLGLVNLFISQTGYGQLLVAVIFTYMILISTKHYRIYQERFCLPDGGGGAGRGNRDALRTEPSCCAISKINPMTGCGSLVPIQASAMFQKRRPSCSGSIKSAGRHSSSCWSLVCQSTMWPRKPCSSRFQPHGFKPGCGKHCSGYTRAGKGSAALHREWMDVTWPKYP